MSKSQDNKPRVTQKDIAQVADVSRVTVTYALKDNPCLPLETRERIQRIAREMGYMRDPLFATLARYRSRAPASCHGVIAWLVWESGSSSQSHWRSSPYYLDYFNGATARARHHGYQVEEFQFNADEMSRKRVGGILHARGISSILLCPTAALRTGIGVFPWQNFSSLSFGYTLRDPALHTVASAHFQNVRTAMREIRQRGYHRIGLIISSLTDIRCNRFASSAFIAEQLAVESVVQNQIILPLCYDPEHFPICESNGPYLDLVVNYAQKNQLDAVLTADYQFDWQSAFSEEIDVFGLSLPAPNLHLEGVVEDSFRIGEVAVDQLVAMIQRGEHGIPRTPIGTHIEGIWHGMEDPATVQSAP